MKFPHVIRKKEMIQAAIIGSAAGLVGVFLFIVLLNSMASEPLNSDEMIPVQSTVDSEGNKQQFFANQYGVFSSFEGATQFVAGYSSLTTSAIVEVDGNYYVWSSVSPTKEGVTITVNPNSFAKAFYYTGASCPESSLKQLPDLLKSNDRSKYYFEDGKIPDELPDDWFSVTQALSTFSEDLNVVRLHVMSHYFSKNECMKISF